MMDSNIFLSLKESIHKMFENTYVNFGWHMGHGESRSGTGSSLEYSQNFSENLVKFINEYNIKSIFDCSCGDWNWMRHISHNFGYYIGNDASDSAIKINSEKFGTDKIKFVCNDAVSQMKTYEDKKFDLVICRHTLEHLPTEYNLLLLSEMKRIGKFGIVTSGNYNIGEESKDINMDGYLARNINLHIEPYVSILNDPILKFSDTTISNVIPEDFISKESLGCFGNIYKFS